MQTSIPGTIVFPAKFDAATAESLRRQFCDALERPSMPIRIDFGKVDQLSVAVVALLLSFAGEARGLPQPPAIEAEGVTTALRALFRVLGLDSGWVVSD
jgi:anti-anti-sigma regulatory factor